MRNHDLKNIQQIRKCLQLVPLLGIKTPKFSQFRKEYSRNYRSLHSRHHLHPIYLILGIGKGWGDHSISANEKPPQVPAKQCRLLIGWPPKNLRKPGMKDIAVVCGPVAGSSAVTVVGGTGSHHLYIQHSARMS